MVPLDLVVINLYGSLDQERIGYRFTIIQFDLYHNGGSFLTGDCNITRQVVTETVRVLDNMLETVTYPKIISSVVARLPSV